MYKGSCIYIHETYTPFLFRKTENLFMLTPVFIFSAVAYFIEALCYKLEGHGSDFQRSHSNFN
jgi:hypothetical protein